VLEAEIEHTLWQPGPAQSNGPVERNVGLAVGGLGFVRTMRHHPRAQLGRQHAAQADQQEPWA